MGRGKVVYICSHLFAWPPGRFYSGADGLVKLSNRLRPWAADTPAAAAKDFFLRRAQQQ